jgi:hypothetical protein
LKFVDAYVNILTTLKVAGFCVDWGRVTPVEPRWVAQPIVGLGLSRTFTPGDALALATTPLLFARNSVLVAVHPHTGAVCKEVFCLGTGRHLRAVLSSVATEAAGDGRSRRNQLFGCFCCCRLASSLLLGVHLLNVRSPSNFIGRTRALLIGDRAVNHALVRWRG